MKVTSRQTYKVIRAILKLKKFTQYEVSKKEKVTFSLVNRVVNWLVSRGYVAKRTGHYELVAPAAIFSLFPVYRKMKPYVTFDVNISAEDALKMMKDKGKLCLTTALSYHDDYYRDPVVHAYLEDKKTIDSLKNLPKGYTHIELYHEDLNKDDFEKARGQWITNKARTVMDLFCSNKAYAAERLIKKEWS
ncbi:MAG: hypothetical protein ABIH29_05620 [Candidatus Micrarchaeota archaeon]